MTIKNSDVFNLSDFPANKIFVNPNEEFRKLLFDKALQNSNNSMEDLAKKLDYSWKHLYAIKRGIKQKGKQNNIRLDLFNKLVYIAKIRLSKANEKIESLRYGRRSTDIPNIFPLKYDSRLAILIGHATGDGHIKGIVYNFEYRNKSKELLNKVYSLIYDIFNIKSNIYSSKDGTSQVEVPSIVGYILHKAGAPVGNKINKKFEIPKWIVQGNELVYKRYLGALVDDEFCISKGRWICFSLSKNIELKDNLVSFFESIRYLLSKLSINSVVKFGKIFSRKDGIKTVNIILSICGQKNYIEFKKSMPITNKAKVISLNYLTNSYILKPYDKYGYNKIKEIALDKLRLGQFTTTQLTKETTITRPSFIKHLRRMRKEGLINEVDRLLHGEILWSLVEEWNRTKEGRGFKLF